MKIKNKKEKKTKWGNGYLVWNSDSKTYEYELDNLPDEWFKITTDTMISPENSAVFNFIYINILNK